MKTRSEIIRALIEPVQRAQATGRLDEELGEVLADIYDLAGHVEDPDELSKLIFLARSAALLLPEFEQLFKSIATIAQDEIMTRHRSALKERLKLKIEITHAWLVEYLGSELLANIIEAEARNEAHD